MTGSNDSEFSRVREAFLNVEEAAPFIQLVEEEWKKILLEIEEAAPLVWLVAEEWKKILLEIEEEGRPLKD